MKSRLFSLFTLAALLFAAGCQTVDDRIKEKPDVYAKLDSATQDKIKQGIIDLGFTPDMVYLALGKPDEQRETISAEGRSEVWVYNTYYSRYDGTQFTGYYRRVYYDPAIRGYRVFYSPAYVETYRPEKEERIRVVFKDGKTSTIEQSK